ncbi:MAG: MoxR family ATPase, partial [Clostridia bacterium]|nr:MoxR family ATPase [Clostridia bacterium]
EPVCTREDILRLQKMVGDVCVSKEMRAYITQIAQASRTYRAFSRGISTRGAISLMHSAQACAMLQGRDYVTPEDVRKMAGPVLAHRVVLSPEARLGMKGATAERVLARLISSVQVPVRIR